MLTSETLAERRQTIGTLFQRARMNAGLEASACAQRLGLSSESYAQIERGAVDVTLPQCELASRLFGVPVTYFWHETTPLTASQVSLSSEALLLVRRRMIGVLLRQARLASSKSLAECATQLEMPTDTLAAYEFGRVDIPLPQLERLAQFLHVPVSYFADDELLSESERERQILEMINQIPSEVRDFVLKPANILYVRLAMLVSGLSTETLRKLGEGLLDITL